MNHDLPTWVCSSRLPLGSVVMWNRLLLLSLCRMIFCFRLTAILCSPVVIRAHERKLLTGKMNSHHNIPPTAHFGYRMNINISIHCRNNKMAKRKTIFSTSHRSRCTYFISYRLGIVDANSCFFLRMNFIPHNPKDRYRTHTRSIWCTQNYCR